MSRKVQAIRYSERGNPRQVAAVQDMALALPGDREALVRMLYAPINPSDINTLEGTYGDLRPMPDTPGNEGIGIIESVGSRVENLSPGMHVLVASQSWRQAGVWKADELIPLSHVTDLRQAAMLRINPASAYGMMRDFHDFKDGEWLAQNAANSGVGRWCIALSQRWRIPSIHFVRRREIVDALSAERVKGVYLDSDESLDAIRKAHGGAHFPLALNAVGGESAARLSRLLSRSGTLVTYGAMSKQPLRVSNGALIFKDIRYRGFWMRNSLAKMDPSARQAMYSELLEMMNQGAVHVPIAEVFPLCRIGEALEAAMASGRAGKILLGLGEA